MAHRRLLLVGGALALLLALALAALLTPAPPAPAVTPRPVNATPELPYASRATLITGVTPVAAYLASAAYEARAPMLRPTSDPLYVAGQNVRYPYGVAAARLLSEVWPNAPTGCAADGSNCAALGIDWAVLDTIVTQQRAWTVTYADGSTGPSPVYLHLPGTYIDPYAYQAGETWNCGTSGRTNCVTLFTPAWMTSQGLTTTFLNTKGTNNEKDTSGNIIYSNRVYNALRYDDPRLLNYLKQFLTAAGPHFSGALQIDGVIVSVGLARESQPSKKDKKDIGTEAQLLYSHEINSGVTCAEYKSFVKSLSEHAYDVFAPRGVDVQAPTLPAPCSGLGGNTPSTLFAWGAELYDDPVRGWYKTIPPRLIGKSIHTSSPDRADAWDRPNWVNAGWRVFSGGLTLAERNYSVSYESQTAPPINGTPVVFDGMRDNYGYLYWANLVQAASGATTMRDEDDWEPYQSALQWAVVDKWLAEKRGNLMYTFRRAEYPIYEWQADRGASGYAPGWGIWLDLPDYELYEQACAGWLRQSAAERNAGVSGNSSYTFFWLPCRSLASQNPGATPTYIPLPSPVATKRPTVTPDALPDLLNRALDRQTLLLGTAGGQAEYDLVLRADYPRFGQTAAATVRLRYLDIGTDGFTVAVPGDTRTITKGGTGNWVETSYSVSALTLTNSLTTGVNEPAAFAIIKNTSGSEYIHQISIDLTGGATGTSTPTATPTITRTPTRTGTPASTATPVYPHGIRFNEINSNEGGDWNLSGSVNRADRYFELVNWQNVSQSLAGWSVTNGTTTYTFAAGVSIPPWARKIWVAERALALPNSGTLTLKNAQATPVATVMYTQAATGLCYAARPDGAATWASEQPCSPGDINP